MLPSESESLILGNMGLVKSIARRFCSDYYEYEDLVQVGSLGLIKAASNFDAERGFAFSTYAFPIVSGEIRRYIRDNGSLKVSRSCKELYYKVCRAKKELSEKLGRSPRISEIAEYIGASEEDIITCEQASEAVLSLDNDENERTLSDILGKEEDSISAEMLALKEEIVNLPCIDRKIVILRYFSDKTQSETAKLIGKTQVFVSRREKAILKYLSEKLS